MGQSYFEGCAGRAHHAPLRDEVGSSVAAGAAEIIAPSGTQPSLRIRLHPWDRIGPSSRMIITGEPMGGASVLPGYDSTSLPVPKYPFACCCGGLGKFLVDNDFSRRAAPFSDRIGSTSG